ncbi:MAG: metallophosphoesterase [Planctomycetota bacterium]
MSWGLSRRQILKTLIAIPGAIAGYFVYKELTEYDGPPTTFGAPDLPPPKPITQSSSSPSFSFFAAGDTGLPSAQRQNVISEMARKFKQRPVDAIFLVGDNFYDRGVNSVTDSKWQRDFEQPFSAQKFPVPFYTCLGNHDYFGNVAAQVEYAQKSDRWMMPHEYYTFSKQISENCRAQFFVVDTTPIEEGSYSTQTQIRWLAEKLESSTAQYKIVIGHHPLYSGGEHGRSRRNYHQLAGLFEKHQIDLYICGHDHDLQLHDTGRGWLHLISGAGSKLRSVHWVDTTMFAQASPGFAKITLDETRLAIELFSPDGLLFNHELKSSKVLAKKAA